MLVPFSELLDEAQRRGRAVGAFTVYNLETADGVLRTAERRDCGVMLLVSSAAFASRIGPTLAAALYGAAQRSGARCCLQLDHEHDLQRIEAALALGFGAVMADGSRMDAEDNAEFVTAAVQAANRHGAQVEAELGHVAGDEEIAAAAARGALTDPTEADMFVDRTGAACLAVSIGNVHGRYRSPPALDWSRLDAVREAVPLALSLHGASGIPDHDVRRAITAGIAKVNVNTELRQRTFTTLGERVTALAEGAALLQLVGELSDAVAEVVDTKLTVFGA